MRGALMALVASWLGCATTRLETVTPDELERRLALAAREEAPAVVFGAVWRDGRTILRAAGRADLGDAREAAAATPFAWFSLTKLFTAAAVMQLVESGRVDLDAPVARYLPEVRLSRDGREATVRHLLSHASGLPDPIPITWIHLASEPGPGLDPLVRERMGTAPELKFEPGAKSSYSNLGYLLLGQVIERVSGERYEEYVGRHVLAPLGCRAASFGVPGDRATGYQRKWSLMGIAARWMLNDRFFDGTVDGYLALRPFTVDGAPYGGLGGPVGDLLRFARAILSGGVGEQGRILEEPTVRALLSPFVDGSGRPTGLGLGWHLGQEGGEPFAYHLGGGGGFRSELRIYPGLGYAVAVLANETSFPTGQLTRLVVR
jgi:CubicO group peptidase (beta-lactamase class C family)